MGLVHETRSELDEAVESYQAFRRVFRDGHLAEVVKGKLAELGPLQRDRPQDRSRCAFRRTARETRGGARVTQLDRSNP